MIAVDKINKNLLPGKAWPLGANFDGRGVNFAISSAHATSIELCIFNEDGSEEIHREALPARSNDIWHGYLPEAKPGLVYGLRAHGAWQPDQGQRFNAQKLLLDPYAKEIVGNFTWRDEHFAHNRQQPNQLDSRENAAWALKAKVSDSNYDWQDDQLLHLPITETVIYEMHVKGFSKTNPHIPGVLRGTFAGLAHPASIAHLKQLGVTAVQLLPVHFALDEERLVGMGLKNYWAYNTLGFFSLNPGFVSEPSKHCPRDEFRDMVKALHRSGIEVLLDVVYNHTAESDETGPSLSFRGLDNSRYYRLPENQKTSYENHTGCGNTLDIRQPRVLQLVLDSLRYWVHEMHVDGFRFDLATVLGRGHQGFDPAAAFFMSLAQDPILSRVKLIAEPWDIGPNGYQVGNFPVGWLEWNDKFRDTTRGFFLHRNQALATRGEFAMRLCGSSDLYQTKGRSSSTSVNYIVSHDGFTLRDLVSYEERHNLANGEENRDGHGHNLSFNAGAEGPSADARINALRAQLQRTLLATSLLSQGTPMLCAGDELGHTQGGNNNPYCQDNETTWIDWAKADLDLIRFTAEVLSLRKRWMPFTSEWTTDTANAKGRAVLKWLTPIGHPLQPHEWQSTQSHALACIIHAPRPDEVARLAMLFNPEHQDLSFNLPPGDWEILLNSALPPQAQTHESLQASCALLSEAQTGVIENRIIIVRAHCLVLLKDNSTD